MDYESTTMQKPETIHEASELAIGNDQLLQMAEQAERRVAAVNAIMKAALGVTTHLDWVNIGGKPYLQETGASKIARLMGVSWKISQPRKVYDEDKSGHYAYHFDGRFIFAGSEIDAFGLRSTHDEFFIGKPGLPDRPQKKPQDVDERDVKQAAYTNCINNGIKRIVPGLRNITIEYLQDAGINTEKMNGYGFNNSGPAQMSGEALDQKADIERMLKEVYGEKMWREGLKKATEFTGKDGNVVQGKTDINKVSEKQMPITHKGVKAKYDKWVKDGSKPLHPVEPTDGTAPDPQNGG